MLIRTIFKDFSKNSTIHGVRYIGEQNRHWSERIWWIIAFGMSVLLCNYYIISIYFNWRANLVTVNFAEKEVSVSEIPFPTVTICPQTKFYKETINLQNAYELYSISPEFLTKTDIVRLETLLHICINPFIKKLPVSSNKFANSSIYNIIEDIAIPLSDTMYYCSWREKRYSCQDLFTTVFTRDGHCFQFNAFNSHEMYTNNIAPEMMTVKSSRSVSGWSLQTGYEMDLNSNEFPYRVFNAKQGAALYIALGLSDNDFNFLCSGPIQGFKVTLSMPGETDKILRRFFEILPSEKSEILIRPKSVVTSSILRSFSPSQRQCFFDSERRLHFFKMYTQNNCEAECLANFTRIECGCVRFSSPRDKQTKVCGMANIDCYRKAEKKLFGGDDLKNDSVNTFRANCNCLPSCTYIKYEADIDRTRFNWTHILRSFNAFQKNYSEIQASVLSVYFASHDVTTLQRTESLTFLNFLGTCGGLLGLFLGVSVLSIIEFIYFLTLRLFWTFWRSRSKHNVVPFQKDSVKSVSINILKPYKPNHYIP